MMRLELTHYKGKDVAAFTGNTYPHKEAIKTLPGKQWDAKGKQWIIPLESVPDAVNLFGRILEVDRSLRFIAKEHEERKHQLQLIKQKTDSDMKKVPGVKATLMSYQAVGLEFLDTLRDGEGAILGFDMGLGKSLTALSAVMKWLNEGKVKHCLVVCPSPLKYATWKKELLKWTDLQEFEDFVVVDGSKPMKVEDEDGKVIKLSGRDLREVQYAQWMNGAKFIIMNYELFIHDSEGEKWQKQRELTEKERKRIEKLTDTICKECEDKTHALASAKAAFLSDTFGDDAHCYKIREGKKWSLYKKELFPSILPPVDEDWAVILDECHRIKNPKAETTKKLRSYLMPAGRKILATGTPLENNLEELWSQVDFCRPGLLGNFYQYRHRYMELDHWGSVVAPKAYMMDELKSRLEPVLIRKTKEEALPELPPLTVQEYWVEMTPEQRRLYKMFADGIVQLSEDDEASYLEVLQQIIHLQQICDSPSLVEDAPVLQDKKHKYKFPVESGKLKELKGLIEDLNPEKNKFVLFSQFRKMTDILYQWLQDEGILKKEEIGYVVGGTDASEIERIQNEFQNGKIKCVLMTTAGNYGLDLSAGSYVICYDQLFNPQKMEQIYARCHRNGVKNAVTVINLVTRDTYEERKLDILESKRALFDAMIDDDQVVFEKLFNSKEDLLDLVS